MSDPLPRAQLSAWQRWEMAAFEAGPAAGLSERDRIAAEAAALRTQAVAAGRDAGYAAGLAQANAERARIAALLATLADNVGEHEQRLVDEVLDLALVLARQIVGEALAVRRDFLLPVVSAALKQLPQSTQKVELALNPADVELVTRFLEGHAAGPACRLVPDPAIAPGGCRIETEQCDMDATTPTRWRRLLASLGRTGDWLEPA
jgi:flagellar assembly protein FliH